MIDPIWTKLINANINSYFMRNSALTGIKQYVEGQDIDLNGSQWLEIRVDGPYFAEQTKDNFAVNLTINIMLTAKKGAQGYSIHDWTGKIQSLFEFIPIYSDIATSNPPIELLFCLNQFGRIRTIPWGDMEVGNANVKIINHSIEGDFKGDLKWQLST